MRAYAAATASTTSFEKIRQAWTGRSEPAPAKTTIIPYRDVLARLCILDEVRGWQPSRHKLLKGRTDLTPRGGTLLGALFESLVTLSVRVYAQAVEATVSHFRTRDGDREADLIVERGDARVLAIEVKLTATPRADAVSRLNWLKKTIGDDLLDRVIITTGKEAYRREDGIAVVPAVLLGP